MRSSDDLMITSRKTRKSRVTVSNSNWISTIPIAHRGLHSKRFPENSLSTFEPAVEAGYGIELDIHCTADSRLAVIHDASTFRVTGQDLLVAEARAGDLAGLRVHGTQYSIPMLEDVLLAVGGRVPVLIEVKPGIPMTRLGPLLVQVLAGYSGLVAVQSFDPRVLMWMRKNAPHVLRGQLPGSFVGEELPSVQKWLLRSMLLNSKTVPRFIAFDIDAMPSVFASLWKTILRVPLLLWTVRTTEQLRRASRCHGVTPRDF